MSDAGALFGRDPRPMPPLAHIGTSILVLERCSSTMDVARSWADAPAGAVVVAHEQDAGRGRHGRVWHGAAGKSLTFSVRLSPPAPFARLTLLPLVIAAGILDALESLSIQGTAMKWPNDLVDAHGAKLAGILVESSSTGEGRASVIAGIGINVGQQAGEFPPELRRRATSIACMMASPPSTLDCLSLMLPTLDARYAAWLSGNDAPLLATWRAKSFDRGRQVEVEVADGGRRRGVVRDFDPSVGLVIEDESGCSWSIAGEHVLRLRHPGLPLDE